MTQISRLSPRGPGSARTPTAPVQPGGPGGAAAPVGSNKSSVWELSAGGQRW